MKLTDEFKPIREWAEQRELYKKGDTKTQFLKLMEEVGELGKAILNKDVEETKDAIGEIVIVLTNLTELANKDIFVKDVKLGTTHGGKFNIYHEIGLDITIEDCINSAYDVIAKRKGKMINGIFVKNE